MSHLLIFDCILLFTFSFFHQSDFYKHIKLLSVKSSTTIIQIDHSNSESFFELIYSVPLKTKREKKLNIKLEIVKYPKVDNFELNY
jgi:hypothetical protein